MTGALGLASRVVVCAWIGAALLWSGSPVPLDVPAELARVTPWVEPDEPTPEVAEAPPDPAREETVAKPDRPSPPEPREKEEEPQATVSIGGDDLRTGSDLLDTGGQFPPLASSYSDFGSFAAYARAMESIGARFVVVRSRRIVAEIDVGSGAIREADASRRFSPRARDYSGEPALARAARSARARYGAGAEVMMLMPRSVDAALFGAITRALGERGTEPSELREIQARYRRGPGGRLELSVDSGQRLDGHAVALGLLFDLDAVARLGGQGA